MYTKINQFNENILVPRNIDTRKEKLRQDALKFLSKETIDDDFELEPYMLDIPEDLIKVKIINGDFSVNYECKLRQFPKWFSRLEIYGSFYCDNNKLLSLENGPCYVEKHYNVSYNTLDSLKGCPKTVNGGFFIQSNILKSLEYGPIEVGGDYNCSFNNLITLKGAPEILEYGDFSCNNNELTSLEFLPKRISGILNCKTNKKRFTIKDINDSDVYGFAN